MSLDLCVSINVQMFNLGTTRISRGKNKEATLLTRTKKAELVVIFPTNAWPWQHEYINPTCECIVFKMDHVVGKRPLTSSWCSEVRRFDAIMAKMRKDSSENGRKSEAHDDVIVTVNRETMDGPLIKGHAWHPIRKDKMMTRRRCHMFNWIKRYCSRTRVRWTCHFP